MEALVLEDALEYHADVPVPSRRPGEALIRVLVTGICATDLELEKGYMGFRGVPGHEFVGEVREDEGGRWVGRRVVGEINCPCGRCDLCRGGLQRHCPNRTVLGIQGRDGAFAGYTTLPEANLHEVPAGVSDEEAVFTEPLAAAFEIPAQVEALPGMQCVVLGDGKLGLLCAQVLALSGCKVHAVGHNREKLDLLEGTGIERYLEGEEPVLKADLVVDATGSKNGLAKAISMARPRGTVVVKSTLAGRYTIDLAPVVIDEIAVVGSRCGPFAPALKALEGGKVKVGEMVSAKYPLSRGAEAFAKAKERGGLKVLLYPGGGAL